MAAFLAGDTPVSEFDYDLPAAAEAEGATVALSVSGQSIEAAVAGNALTGSWRGLNIASASDQARIIYSTSLTSGPIPIGRHPVYAITTIGGRTERTLIDWLVVVDPADEWHNVLSARFEWAGAPDSDGVLASLLDVARDQVQAYAPNALSPTVPERYRAGQLMQARNTYSASITNGDAQVDAGGVVISVRPLDWAVKQLLRPKTGTKAIF